jgi:hypothetical protein
VRRRWRIRLSIDGKLEWFCAEHRLRQWSADACIATAVDIAPVYDGPPDLQTLVVIYRSYEKISPEAWAEFDAAMKAWQTRRREKYRRR